MRFELLRRTLRHPRLARHYPARFRTTSHQAVRELWTWIRDQLDAESRGFDREHGTATSWFDLGNYEPTPPSVVRAILDDLPQPLESLSFVDVGSGKGRVVLIASQRPFARVVGIERGRLLHWRAGRNLERFVGDRCVAPELVRADVLDAPLPAGPLVLFLYNPFGSGVLEALLRRVRSQDVHLVMVNPPEPALLERQGFAVCRQIAHASEDRRWTRLFRASDQAEPM